MKKKIVILGATGSIGTNALWVAQNLADEVEVIGIAAGTRSRELAEQACRFNVQHAVIGDPELVGELDVQTPDACRCQAGPDSLVELATLPEADIILCAITGVGGLEPVIAAIEAGKDIALASKEILVSAGELVMGLVDKHDVKLLPVDSEHSAIFQCLQGCRKEDINRLLLTASGGPFRESSPSEIAAVNYKEALAHPTWDMGPKITVDSATMMNKGLELIEAYWLFGIPHERIDVVIHPESIIHSGIELIDSGLLVQMGMPDMRLPIQYALTYPERRPADLPRCRLAELANLTFHALDNNKFPAIKLAREALDIGDTAPAVFNAANEVAVELFSQDQISFPDIWTFTAKALDRHIPESPRKLDNILQADKAARQMVKGFI
ncbi:MAG: 1-deoxy-D-xylulose-5-phosphate reductoisomerase [Lentisphaeria bacterium]